MHTKNFLLCRNLWALSSTAFTCLFFAAAVGFAERKKQIYASAAVEHIIRPVQESVQPDNGRRTDFDYSDSDRLYFCAEVFQRRPYGWRRERIKAYD